MPRRNNTPKLTRKIPQQSSEGSKTRYSTKHAALLAAQNQMRYNPDLQLTVYQSLHDGGWYLTSKLQD